MSNRQIRIEPGKMMSDENKHECQINDVSSTSLSRPRHFNQDTFRCWLGYVLGIGSITVLLITIDVFVPDLVETAQASDQHRLQSKYSSYFLVDLALILYCIGIVAAPMLAIVTILFRTNLSWAVLTFFSLFLLIYLGSTTLGVYFWPEPKPPTYGQTKPPSYGQNGSAFPMDSRMFWREWQRRLINHGYPFVSFMGGAYIAALMLRIRNRSYLSCAFAKTSEFNAYPLFSFTLATLTILFFFWLIFGHMARGSYGTIHGMMYSVAGATSTFIAYVCLHKILGSQNNPSTSRFLAVFFSILSCGIMGLWILHFQGFPFDRSSLPIMAVRTGSFLLILVSAIAFVGAWLWGCGWRLLNQTGSFAQWTLLELFVCVMLIGTVIGVTIRARIVNAPRPSVVQQTDRDPQVVNEFIAAAQNEDALNEDALARRFGPLLDQEQLAGLLDHTDAEVRLASMHILGKRSIAGFGMPPNHWMKIVGNSNEQMQLRRKATFYLLSSVRVDKNRKSVIADLRKLPGVAEVVVQPFAEYLEDRSQVFWQPGGGFLAPTDVVEMLTSLGPAAVDALPALEKAMNHENDYQFVPAVVKAIARIGEANSREVLEKATQFKRTEVRNAAIEALKSLNLPSNE